MIGRVFYGICMRLPRAERLKIARWRFQKAREGFYRESRLDIEQATGLRNRETLIERLQVLKKRARDRRQIVWLAYDEMEERMRKGDGLALAIKPFVPVDEYSLLDLAFASDKDDAARRGFDLCEMAASAKRVLSSTTAMQMAYPMVLLCYMYGLSMLFGGMVYPQVLEVRPLEQWMPAGKVLYAVDTYCYDYWMLNVCLLAAGVFSYYYGLKRWTGTLRNRIDATPLMWRNRRDLRAALLIVSLSGLLDSGLTLAGALGRLRRHADPWLRWHISTMERRLKASPELPMRAFATGIFSEELVDRIADAERRDNFVDAIKSLGRSSLDRVVEAVRRNARITHYVLLGIAAAAFIGIGVGSYVVTGVTSMQNALGAATGNTSN
ncbi:type II secretion system F family protein [Paraburkholderia sp. CNPSo 3076]|uniref:type II secretion system F family protein n=1 Tax=Paraburkholderia sp. CNPSo 3076 TaxID=2940936 RepID=UPI00224FF4B3|nr:type II secretion system F family protein [Paraburkholderia sp. CNPSo 3076]MCX5544667.1 type II secretion system F family protein [Paraburkholderia sp. CNPSo 3076]